MGRGISSTRTRSRTLSTRRGMKRQRTLSKLRTKLQEGVAVSDIRDDDLHSIVSENEEESVESPEVLTKYKTAARYLNEALKLVIDACVVGASTVTLCKLGDRHVHEQLSTVYRNTKDEQGNRMSKGLAFPTNVSVNHIVANYTSMNDEIILKEGDVVKIHIGCHIDGYPVLAGHTVVVSGDNSVDVSEAHAVTRAAYYAAQAVSRMLHPDESNYDMTDAILFIADHFHVQPANGVLSHRVKRFIIDGQKCILTRRVLDEDPQIEINEFTVGTNQLYNIDIVFTTNSPALRPSSDAVTTIYRKNEILVPVRLKSARQALAEVRKKFMSFPFTVQDIYPDDLVKSKFGVKTLLHAGLLDAQPVFESKGNTKTARFSCTAFVTERHVDILCGLLPLTLPEVPLAPEIVSMVQRSLQHPKSATKS